MRRITITAILALALLLPLAAQAEDDPVKKGTEDLFLGRNLRIQLTVAGGDFEHSVELLTAADYFKLDRSVGGWEIWARGWLKPVRDAYLIQVDVNMTPPAGTSKERSSRGRLESSGSALLELGKEVIIVRSGDWSIKMKVTEVR